MFIKEHILNMNTLPVYSGYSKAGVVCNVQCCIIQCRVKFRVHYCVLCSVYCSAVQCSVYCTTMQCLLDHCAVSIAGHYCAVFIAVQCMEYKYRSSVTLVFRAALIRVVLVNHMNTW